MTYVFSSLVFLLWLINSHTISAEKEILYEGRSLSEWRESAGSKDAEKWTYYKIKGIQQLLTKISKSGKSWFISKVLDLPIASYLKIEAKPTNCAGDPSCYLDVYGSTQRIEEKHHTANYPDFIKVFNRTDRQKYKSETKVNRTFTINGAFKHLAIFASTEKNNTSWNIFSLEMYHFYCKKNETLNLERTNSNVSDVHFPVKCRQNAVLNSDGKSQSKTVSCRPNGTWDLSETCQCDKGFGLQQNMKCMRCDIDKYKRTIEDIDCKSCPEGKTNNKMHTDCECKADHYVGETENGKCYSLPPKISNLNMEKIDTSILLSWSTPKTNEDLTITYKVEWFVGANFSKLCGNKTINTTKFSLPNLCSQAKFKIIVYTLGNLTNVNSSKWNFVEMEWSPVSNETGIKDNVKVNQRRGFFIYIGVGITSFVVLLTIIIVLVIRLRKGKNKPDGTNNIGFESISLPALGQKVYIDPANYENPEAALKEFVNEICYKSLLLERVLGGGEFGDVYKGTLKTDDRGALDVAAKTLKHDADQRSKNDFFMEASAMGQFDDLNVIHLEGVITKTVPHMIITEYMSNGSLDNFLKQNDGSLTELQLLGMARGVASGMKYLASIHFVHRDIAARNILVNEAMLCKVADFGLSRVLETADSSRGEYQTTGGKIPVRWTAPEAIKYRKFSTASDVWSYGILLWEIMSFAERPYWDWDNFKVLERVDEGYRLPAPKSCPKAVHELMHMCWEADRSQRPEFASIVKIIDEWIRSPETLKYVSLSRKRPVSMSGISDPAMLVKDWLNEIRMSSYIPHFKQAGFVQLSELGGLLDGDLQVIGVNLIGHRNKMLRTIRNLPVSEGSKNPTFKRSESLKV
ncbi:ephrin type-B receptor 2-like [Xenia sp. Carnegie-2017]|uniref:ephrin type-B receptor 2-like n=1 Tax=Xenia sp. Carnegie-2017 TaxID=2897299 RepID=UPI001F035E70|nr:ephrin type-B receptor 2-like [Xenia sp. Carnegie-2017]